MNSQSLSRIAATLLPILLASPFGLTAQNPEHHNGRHHHYHLIDMGTFGGSSSYFNALADGGFFGTAKVLNTRAVAVAWADTSISDPFPASCFNADCFVSDALRWHNGSSTDLGGLAEGWSSAATWINDAGAIVGISQNGIIDPLIGFPEQRAVVWRDGRIADLGTIGGNQSLALSVNNRGQVAGLALNETPDSVSIFDYFFYSATNGTQTRAVLWNKDGVINDLGTLGTGPDAAAFLVNNRGQVAGFSYVDSAVNPDTGVPTFHPFLWEEGRGMRDLGTLGGTIAQAVNGLNEDGQVVGATTMPGDQTHHPFLWDGNKLIDLGTFGGDNGEADWINNTGDVVGIAQPVPSCTNGNGGHAFLWHLGALRDLGTTAGLDNSEGVYINSETQVVGHSFNCDFTIFGAFLWEHGSIVDLNALIPSDSNFSLSFADFINDGGEIAALGDLPNGDQHAVLLIPCDENHSGVDGCDYSLVYATAATDKSPAPVTHEPTTPNPRRLHPFGRPRLTLPTRQVRANSSAVLEVE